MSIIAYNTEQDELPGGVFRATVWGAPIAYTANGAWRRISNQLCVTGDPGLSWGVDELIQFRLRPALTGNAPLVHIGRGLAHVRFTPLGTHNVAGEMWGPNGFVYPGAWTGANLRLQVGGHLVRKEIQLFTGHPAAFEFRVDESAGGFDEQTGQGGGLYMPDPWLEHPDTGITIPLAWQRSQQGGRTIMRVELPPGDWAGWVLDPTTTIQPSSADTYIRDTATTTNFGTAIAMVSGDGSGSLDQKNRFLVKFDYSSVPASAAVTNANVELYEFDAADGAGLGSWTMEVRRCLRNWVETQATWNIYSTGNNWTTAGAGSDGNDRSASNSATSTRDGAADAAFVTLTGATLIDDVQKYVNGTYSNYGWLVQSPSAESAGTPTAYTNYRTANYATDTSQRPKSTVDYTDGVPPKMRYYRNRR
jgi:hypothetical protein